MDRKLWPFEVLGPSLTKVLCTTMWIHVIIPIWCGTGMSYHLLHVGQDHWLCINMVPIVVARAKTSPMGNWVNNGQWRLTVMYIDEPRLIIDPSTYGYPNHMRPPRNQFSVLTWCTRHHKSLGSSNQALTHVVFTLDGWLHPLPLQAYEERLEPRLGIEMSAHQGTMHHSMTY